MSESDARPLLRLRAAAAAACWLLILLLTGPARAQTAPQVLKLVESPVTGRVLLQVTKWDTPFQPGKKLSGVGDILIFLGPIKTGVIQRGLSFRDVVADDRGQIQDGKVTLARDMILPNALNTGVNLLFAAGSSFAVARDASGVKAGWEGTARVYVPALGLSAGTPLLTVPARLTYTASQLTFLATGAKLPPGLVQSVRALGFTFRAEAADFGLVSPAKSGAVADMRILLRSVRVDTPIPNLLAQDKKYLALEVKEVGLDTELKPTFRGAKLIKDAPPQPQPSASSRQVSARLAASIRDRTIHLAKPLDFALTVEEAEVSVSGGRFDQFEVQAGLALPPSVKDANGDRVELKGVRIDVLSGALIPHPQKLDILWNNFRLTVEKTILDLSPSAGSDAEVASTGGRLPNIWQGVYITEGALELPPGLGGVKVAVRSFYLDDYGINGSVGLKELTDAGTDLSGFKAKLTGGELTFSRGRLVGGGLSGEIVVPEWGGKINLNVNVSNAGLVTVTLGTPEALEIKGLGLKVKLDSAAIKTGADGFGSLLLTGAFEFRDLPRLRDLSLKFTDLSIDSSGNVRLPANGGIQLSRPVQLDLKVFSLMIRDATIGRANNNRFFKFTGEVNIPDCPISGTIRCKGLTITESAAGPRVGLEGIEVNARIMGVADVTGEVNFRSPTDNTLYGKVRMGILSSGAGGGAEFFVHQNSWYVAADFILPQASQIPIGTTGLYIYGFRGGLGRNVAFVDVAGPNEPLRNYQVKPAPEERNWLIQAGLFLGTAERYFFWGAGTLTMMFPRLLINIGGEFYLLEDFNPAGKPDAERKAVGNVTWDSGSSSFRANLGVDFSFPSRSLPFARSSGNMDLLISPAEKHFWLGWPVESRPVQVTMAKVFTATGGMAVDFHAGTLQAAMRKGIDLGPFHGEIAGAVSAMVRQGVSVGGSYRLAGEVNFIVFRLGAAAIFSAAGSTNPAYIDLSGRFEACIRIRLLFVKKDICAGVGLGARIDSNGLRLR